MILTLDIGNGSIKYAFFEAGGMGETGRLALDADLTPFSGVREVAAVSVNPPVLDRARASLPGLRAVGEELAVPIAVHYDPPEACGLDRVMGVVGALDLSPAARGVLLLDAGTCLTATVGLRDEGVLGGAILPGPDLMAQALALGTAGLPRVAFQPPAAPIGTSTEESIRVGIDAARRGAVRELVQCIRAASPPLEVVAVGTGAAALAAVCPEVDSVHPQATLRGVYLAAARRGLPDYHSPIISLHPVAES